MGIKERVRAGHFVAQYFGGLVGTNRRILRAYDRGGYEAARAIWRKRAERALEIARADKRIGSALESCVIVHSPDEELLDFLRGFGDELRFLLITSGVELTEVGDEAYRSETMPGLAVEVRRAEGTKCARCWNVTLDVGQTPEWPAICARCASGVRRILAGAKTT